MQNAPTASSWTFRFALPILDRLPIGNLLSLTVIVSRLPATIAASLKPRLLLFTNHSVIFRLFFRGDGREVSCRFHIGIVRGKWKSVKSEILTSKVAARRPKKRRAPDGSVSDFNCLASVWASEVTPPLALICRTTRPRVSYSIAAVWPSGLICWMIRPSAL